MKSLILILVLALSGCGATQVDSWQINVATSICSNHGGISYLNTQFAMHVVCADGNVKSITSKRVD